MSYSNEKYSIFVCASSDYDDRDEFRLSLDFLLLKKGWKKPDVKIVYIGGNPLAKMANDWARERIVETSKYVDPHNLGALGVRNCVEKIIATENLDVALSFCMGSKISPYKDFILSEKLEVMEI